MKFFSYNKTRGTSGRGEGEGKPAAVDLSYDHDSCWREREKKGDDNKMDGWRTEDRLTLACGFAHARNGRAWHGQTERVSATLLPKSVSQKSMILLLQSTTEKARC